MSKHKPSKPTEAELEILQIIWANGPSSVRFVNDLLNEKREVGYTTTLKIMQIMLEKGLLTRNTDQRTHIYRAGIDQDKTQRALLMQFIQDTFQGASTKMVMQILGNSKPSNEELEEIKAMIQKIENDRS